MRSTSAPARPELTGTLVRLMLSVNDIALAADANDQWAERGDRKRAAMRIAAWGNFERFCCPISTRVRPRANSSNWTAHR